MATATIIGSGDITSGARKAGLTSASEVPIYLDPDQLRQPEYTVYLHTISRREFLQPHPIYRNVRVPECPEGKRSICFMRIQHPVQQPTLNPDDVNGPPAWKMDNARSVALGICNPGYGGKDLTIQDKELDPEAVIASGECNLNRQGIFASMNAVPTEDELRKAEGRRERYYKFRLQEADGLERSNPRRLQEILMKDHHMAAEFFGIEANWHRMPTAKVSCTNCGEKMPQGAAFHYLSNGRPCVTDWERSWLAGVVKKDEVPEPKRWWPIIQAGISVPSSDGESLGRGTGATLLSYSQMTKEQLQQYAKGRGLEVDMRWSEKTLIEKIQETH